MNAKQELQHEFERIGKKPICASIHDGWGGDGSLSITLKKGHTDLEFTEFMDKLDFDYDAGYGAQYIDGTVWFEDGTWLSRGEYDGSEWWVYLKTPEIPEYLEKHLI
jgi:hypothetical protein